MYRSFSFSVCFKMSLKAIKLVTFDATNTLLKFRVPPWQSYTIVARDYGYKGTEENIKGRMLMSYRDMWKIYPNFGKSQITWEKWWTHVVKKTFEGQLSVGSADIEKIAGKLINEFKTSKCWTTAPSGDRLLAVLKGHDIRLGVISNFDPRLNEILQNVNIKKYFDFILTSYQIGYSKPDKRIFKHALDQCTDVVDPLEALHIGDDLNTDYEGARAAGWHALLISEKVKSEKPPASRHVFKNLEELSIVIEKNELKL